MPERFILPRSDGSAANLPTSSSELTVVVTHHLPHRRSIHRKPRGYAPMELNEAFDSVLTVDTRAVGSSDRGGDE
jgi:hypothetical protein